MKRTLVSMAGLTALVGSLYAGDTYSGKVVIENPCSFYVQVTGGATFGVGGEFISSFDAEVSGLPLINHLPITHASARELSFDDIYGNAASYGIRVGRACEAGRFYVGFEYTEASGGPTHIGNIILGVDPAVWADFSDYRDYALLVGVERDLFRGRGASYGKNPVAFSKLRPWVGGQLGIRFVDGIDANVHMIDLYGNLVPGSVANGVKFYDDSIVFTASFTLGLAYDLNERVSIGIETGLRYQTKLDGIDDDLANYGFESANDKGNLLAVPVLGTVAIRF